MQATKYGKFISPHLVKYNERISINHREITDKEMSDILDRISKKVEIYKNKHEIKEFEVLTILALIYFAENECDFVVLETGLGGRYDPTNIADGMISVITDIGLDHMDILGNTVEEIAKEKAGIIKENYDTVMCNVGNVTDIIRKTCMEKNNTLHLVNQDSAENYSFDNKFQKFDYKNYKDLLINLKGKCQIKNSLLAIECAEILKSKGYEIGEEAIKSGLKTVIHKARFEILNEDPTVIFDGGHNEDAINNLKNTINTYYPNEKKIYIVSILKSKDYKTIVKLLAEDKKGIFIFTSRK
ncbi:MAG: hypothetical protein K2H53_05230 [Clostridia bacterium]|nr:hypothetical protein [Clostridia bacterium]